MARVTALVADLMLASRVEEGLRAAGHDVSTLPSMPEAPDAEAIVCDLDLIDPVVVAASGIPALGFYAHVDVETRRRAEEAGIALVVPRSRMARELPALVERLLT